MEKKETQEQKEQRLQAEAAEALLQQRIDVIKRKYARPDADGKKIPLSEVIVLKVGDKTAFLRKPDRKILGMARSLGEGDYIRINELILDAVWLEGDEEIRTDDDYFLNAIPSLEGMIDKKEVKLKKS